MATVITGVDAIHVQLYVPRWIDFSEGDGKKSPKALENNQPPGNYPVVQPTVLPLSFTARLTNSLPRNVNRQG